MERFNFSSPLVVDALVVFFAGGGGGGSNGGGVEGRVCYLSRDIPRGARNTVTIKMVGGAAAVSVMFLK